MREARVATMCVVSTGKLNQPKREGRSGWYVKL